MGYTGDIPGIMVPAAIDAGSSESVTANPIINSIRLISDSDSSGFSFDQTKMIRRIIIRIRVAPPPTKTTPLFLLLFLFIPS